MYSQLLIFLRFGCYVHNPNAIYAKAATPVINWLDQIQAEDHEIGYSVLSVKNTPQSVISIDVPSTMHHALITFDANFIYTDPAIVQVRALLAAKKNHLRLTTKNLRTFFQITKVTPAEFVSVVESYLNRIEMNPMQPVDLEELKAIKDLGVDWRLAARLPRVDINSFDKIYIVDEHHRVRCL